MSDVAFDVPRVPGLFRWLAVNWADGGAGGGMI
jgi:hypothetical protein